MPCVFAAAVYYLLRYCVHNILLDGAAQIASAVCRGVALPDKVVNKGIVPRKLHAALGYGTARFLEHQNGYTLEVCLGETVEVDYLVYPVYKLGSPPFAGILLFLFEIEPCRNDGKMSGDRVHGFVVYVKIRVYFPRVSAI